MSFGGEHHPIVERLKELGQMGNGYYEIYNQMTGSPTFFIANLLRQRKLVPDLLLAQDVLQKVLLETLADAMGRSRQLQTFAYDFDRFFQASCDIALEQSMDEMRKLVRPHINLLDLARNHPQIGNLVS